MKACWFGVVALTVTPALAQDVGSRQSKPDKADMPSEAAEAAVERSHRRLLEYLKLTDAQDKAVREALADYRRDRAVWLRRNGPKIQRLREQIGKYHTARDAKTVEAVRAAMQGLGKLRAERASIQRKLLTRLKKLLTEEQYAKAEAAINPLPPPSAPVNKFHYLGQLGLTKKQLAQIRTLMAEARKAKDSGGTGTRAQGSPLQEAWARIVKEVLTEKDREKLADLIRMTSHQRMVMAMFQDVALTKEQAARIDAIWKKAYEQAKRKPDSRFDIYSKAQQEVIQDVLAPEQRKALSRRSQRMPVGHPSTAPARRK